MVDKMTKLLHRIPLLRQLDNLECNHNGYSKITDAKQVARWGWQLNILIAQGIEAHLKYVRNYDRTQILTDRPRDCTTGTLPHQNEMIVQIGHKQRPLRDAGDADWEFPVRAADALPLGVTEVLPRTPGIWPTTFEMNECNVECEQPEPPEDVPNYPSAAEREDRIEATYIQERALDPPFATAAKTTFHAERGKLEGRYSEKLRTIHDATVNKVNLWIRRHQPERTTAPGLFDLLYAIHYLHHMDTTRYTILKTDVTKAHRRMLIKQQDWKYMVAMIKVKYWINKVGTYGVASAQYHWGRLAALILRLLYYTFPDIAWAFVYVDDYLVLLPECCDHKLPLTILLFLTAL
ncbi:unnamed protein product [Polarella glacialis]|uniref:Reverse transcriptase domain-containing protein n=1 Tax=Polarella glacialis TaxID=89957 RepID=A0A813DWJ9_POLGL|nr:unnamed protein product [Polarella glacialis]